MREFARFFSNTYASISGLGGSVYLQGATGDCWQPPVDIFEREQELLIVVELPGVNKEQISATVEGDMLRIAGYRAKSLPEGTRHVLQMEIPYGHFGRSVRLPNSVDVNRIEAAYENGFLTIRIPRKNST